VRAIIERVEAAGARVGPLKLALRHLTPIC
jgi:hypothetical protein